MSQKKFIICLLLSSLAFFACKNNEKIDDKTDVLALLHAKIKADPKNPELYYEQAKVLFGKDRLEDATISCQTAIKLKDNNAKYHLLFGDILLKKGSTDESFSSIEKALALEPNNINANLKLAELSLFLKNYDRVLELTKKVNELDKLNATAYFIKGYALKEMGDTIAAVKAYSKTTELDPENQKACEELGLLYALKKDKLAIDYFNTAIRINPKNTIAMYALALFYQDNNMITEALPIYENILAIAPNHADALNNLGYIEAEYNGNPAKGIEYISKAIIVDPSFIEAYYNRAIAYEETKNVQAAINDYKKITSLNPNHQKAKDALKRLGVK